MTPMDVAYVTSLEEVLWGATLLAVTMIMHGFGMLGILRVNTSLNNRFRTEEGHMASLLLVILASWMILLLHLTEVMVWALFFLWKGAFANRSIAFYFSLNEYTTVGSNFNLPLHWRLLEGMIATAGLLTFAWSTGILITLAQEFQDRRLLQLQQRQERTDKQ